MEEVEGDRTNLLWTGKRTLRNKCSVLTLFLPTDLLLLPFLGQVLKGKGRRRSEPTLVSFSGH